MRNWPQTANGVPPLPKDRTEYEIPSSYMTLPDGSSFLAYDSGITDQERILIFTSSTGLCNLSTCSVWACDATFKAAPNLWTPLFTIHVVIDGACFPRLFALLQTSKSKLQKNVFSRS